MIYLCNTFSVHMLGRLNVNNTRTIRIRRISSIETGNILKSNAFRSFYGHTESVKHLSRYLHLKVPVCRGTVNLEKGDILIIATISSKRDWEKGLKPYPKWRFFELELK